MVCYYSISDGWASCLLYVMVIVCLADKGYWQIRLNKIWKLIKNLPRNKFNSQINPVFHSGKLAVRHFYMKLNYVLLQWFLNLLPLKHQLRIKHFDLFYSLSSPFHKHQTKEFTLQLKQIHTYNTHGITITGACCNRSWGSNFWRCCTWMWSTATGWWEPAVHVTRKHCKINFIY